MKIKKATKHTFDYLFDYLEFYEHAETLMFTRFLRWT